MPKTFRLSQIFLWLFVVFLSILVGAAVYETLVVWPANFGAPPQSVWTLSDFWRDHPSLRPDSGFHFWIFFTPTTGLLALVNVIFALRASGKYRMLLLLASVPVVILISATFVYYVPTLGVIWDSQELGLSGDLVAAKVNMWLMLNSVRAVILVVCWFFLLRAFGLSHQNSQPLPE
ncbi:MAG TPA: hypothetical protein VGO50_15360 [Pyrinomonadaceae bacterium]|jgi:hypothetical protein|nr:hypothetical protein [Pyrinomonadaceae bacterium]